MKKLLLSLGAIAAVAAPTAAVVACGATIEKPVVNENKVTNVVERVMTNIANTDGFSIEGLSISANAEDAIAKLDGLTLKPIANKADYFFADSATENMNRNTNTYGVLPVATYGLDKDAEYMVKVVKEDGEPQSMSFWRLSLNAGETSLEFTNSGKEGSGEVAFVKQSDTRILKEGTVEATKIFDKVKGDYIRKESAVDESVSEEFYTKTEAQSWSDKYGVDMNKYFTPVIDVLDEGVQTHTLAISDGEPMIIDSVVTDVELFDKLYAAL